MGPWGCYGNPRDHYLASASNMTTRLVTKIKAQVALRTPTITEKWMLEYYIWKMLHWYNLNCLRTQPSTVKELLDTNQVFIQLGLLLVSYRWPYNTDSDWFLWFGAPWEEWSVQLRWLLCLELIPAPHTSAQYLASFPLVRMIGFQQHNTQQHISRDSLSAVSIPKNSCCYASIIESIHGTNAHQTELPHPPLAVRLQSVNTFNQCGHPRSPKTCICIIQNTLSWIQVSNTFEFHVDMLFTDCHHQSCSHHLTHATI